VVVDVEATDGRRVRGYAGDNLAPKWFDKDPSKSFRDNIKDERAAIRIAHQAYLEAAKVPRSVFQIWLDAFAECRRLVPACTSTPSPCPSAPRSSSGTARWPSIRAPPRARGDRPAPRHRRE
jgi:hypothetical protein